MRNAPALDQVQLYPLDQVQANRFPEGPAMPEAVFMAGHGGGRKKSDSQTRIFPGEPQKAPEKTHRSGALADIPAHIDDAVDAVV